MLTCLIIVHDLAVCRVAAPFVLLYRGLVWYLLRHTDCRCLLLPFLIAVCVGSWVLLGLFFLLRVTHALETFCKLHTRS